MGQITFDEKPSFLNSYRMASYAIWFLRKLSLETTETFNKLSVDTQENR